MTHSRCCHERRATTLVEFAVVAPVTFLLIFGLIIGGLGVFRYQEVASLAREGARYASVRGAEYQAEAGNPAATPEDVYNNAILPNAVALDPNKLGYSVTWLYPDKSVQHIINDNYETVQTNTVTVTVTYQWVPELYLVGPLTLTSSSTMPLTY